MLDGDEEIAEYNGATVLRHYVTGPGVDDRIAHAEGSAIANPTKTYYHVNHQGSVMAMTDGSGNLTQRVGYDEYGNGSPATGEQFGYTGRRYDPETGLYYYRARYYAPAIGRFLQVDPVGYKDNLNLYTYVWNDPLDRTDPSGNEGEASLNDEPGGGPSLDDKGAKNTKPGTSPPPSEKPKSTSTLRKLWEKLHGKPWPKDPATGGNQDVAHIKAKADGGAPNDPKNFNPQPHDQHMQEHIQNGDFKRWGARSGSGVGGKALGAAGALISVPGAIIDLAKDPDMSPLEFLYRAFGAYELGVESGQLPPPPPKTSPES